MDASHRTVTRLDRFALRHLGPWLLFNFAYYSICAFPILLYVIGGRWSWELVRYIPYSSQLQWLVVWSETTGLGFMLLERLRLSIVARIQEEDREFLRAFNAAFAKALRAQASYPENHSAAMRPGRDKCSAHQDAPARGPV